MSKTKKTMLKIVIYAACIVVGAAIGLGINVLDISFLELVIAVLVGYNISVIVHESGHLVFGLLSGYGFSSFRIWSLMLLKADGKYSFRRYSLAGTGGQCLMIPPEKNSKDIPVILYNLGGIIFNLILSAVCMAIYLAHPHIIVLSPILLITAILSAVTFLTNGIPLNIGGISNDGMNSLSLSKDNDAKEAFLNQLRINEAQTRGIRLRDMPDEWFEIPDGVDHSNVTFSSTAVFRINRSFDTSFDPIRCEREVSEILASDWNIIGVYKNLLSCDLVLCRLLNYGKDADISAVTTPQMQQFRKSMKSFLSIIRTEYAIALLHDGNMSEAEKKLVEFEKAAKRSPSPSDVASERELLAIIREKSTKSEAER